MAMPIQICMCIFYQYTAHFTSSLLNYCQITEQKELSNKFQITKEL